MPRGAKYEILGPHDYLGPAACETRCWPAAYAWVPSQGPALATGASDMTMGVALRPAL